MKHANLQYKNYNLYQTIRACCFISIVLLLPCFSLLSQTTYNDAQFWIKSDFDFNFSKRVNPRFAYQSRFSENISRYNYSYYDFGISYRINKDMKLVFDYILVEYRQPEGYFSTRHQYNISWYCRYKIDRITLVNRILQEAQYKDYFSSDKGKHLQDFYIRDKVTLRYKHNKQITSYIADEVYYRMDYGYFKGFNRNRLYAGILWSITKTNQLELFYLIENNYNVSRPSNNYIIGIGYNMNLF